MLPEERACYIDLLIFQHQNNDFIPNDIKRVALFCSGCSEELVKTVLEAKFKLSLNGWQNEKLSEVIFERNSYKEIQSIKGQVGQFFKKMKFFLTKDEFEKFKKLTENQTFEEIFEEIKGIQLTKELAKAMLKAKLKHLEDENEIEIENKDESIIDIKNKVGKKFSKEELDFDFFRKQYPGVKGGLETEFKNFKKKAGWEQILGELIPAIEREKQWRAEMKQAGQFVPEWQHLKTWINQSGWTKEFPAVEIDGQTKTNSKDSLRRAAEKLKAKINENGNLHGLLG